MSQDAIAFTTKLLALLDDARTTTSYKFAVLLALTDLCQESVGRLQGPAGSVTTRQLALKVLELYWPQTRGHGQAGVLRQLTRQQRSIVDLVGEFQRGLDRAGRASPTRARSADPAGFEDLVDEIEWILIRYPLPLLQQVGSRPVPTLFAIDWKEQPSRSPVAAYQLGLRRKAGESPEGDFDNCIRFLPGVETHLARFAPVFRALIRRDWARFVARCNASASEELRISDLEDFLFEPERASLRELHGPLRDFQRGECFLCTSGLGKSVEVDHFLPWSRCSNNALENLVLAHGSCNRAKSNHLAGGELFRRWWARLDADGSELDRLRGMATNLRWVSRPTRTKMLARSMYLGLPEGAPLWVAGKEFEVSDPRTLSRLLAQGHAG